VSDGPAASTSILCDDGETIARARVRALRGDRLEVELDGVELAAGASLRLTPSPEVTVTPFELRATVVDPVHADSGGDRDRLIAVLRLDELLVGDRETLEALLSSSADQSSASKK